MGNTPYDPCAGKSEDASCRLCDPLDFSCFETAVHKTCQGGTCQAAPSTTSAPTTTAAPYDPCAGKSEDASCRLCDPLDFSCFETAAHKTCQGGTCQAAPSTTPAPATTAAPYDACAGKSEDAS